MGKIPSSLRSSLAFCPSVRKGIVAITARFSASMAVTLRSPLLLTKTFLPSGAAAMAWGASPTGIVPTLPFVIAPISRVTSTTLTSPLKVLLT